MDAGHDSLVTVRLSEPPILTVDTTLAEAHEQQPVRPATIMSPNDNSIAGTPGTVNTAETATPRDSLVQLPGPDGSRTLEEELGACADDDEPRPSLSSEDQDEVNWEQLEKTEDEQTKDEETDNVRRISMVSPWIFALNPLLIQSIVNSSPACTARAGKRETGYQPEERQGRSR
jgi:hypothetical protein